eukprot:3728147-Rhodomonas_salina.2
MSALHDSETNGSTVSIHGSSVAINGRILAINSSNFAINSSIVAINSSTNLLQHPASQLPASAPGRPHTRAVSTVHCGASACCCE